MAVYSEILGGVTVLGSQATVLSSEIAPCCQLTFRTLPTAARIYFGNVDVTPAGDNAHGYVEGGEWHQYGPYTRGGGIRPTQVFLAGTAGTVVLWSAWPA